MYIKAVIGRSSKPKPFREQTVGESLYGFAYEMHPWASQRNLVFWDGGTVICKGYIGSLSINQSGTAVLLPLSKDRGFLFYRKDNVYVWTI